MRKIYQTFLAILGLTLMTFSAVAQNNAYWSLSSESASGRNLFAKSQRPIEFKIYQLNETLLKNVLQSAPSDATTNVANSNLTIQLPDDQGQMRNFKVVNAPSMEAALAAKFPNINSYAGVEASTGATVRFDVSPFGLHATISEVGKPKIYIDQIDGNFYRVVARNKMPNAPATFVCNTEDIINTARTAGTEVDADDGRLRIFRLAMISGAEFSQFYLNGTELTLADSVGKVIAAQNSHVTRSNDMYERDFGIRLLLVANNNLIVYFDPLTDPVSNPNSPNNVLLQAAIDAQIGAGNYDIGHTESRGSDNGNAGCIGCVCVNGTKGRGWTVYQNPALLEFFVIDYLTHEFGHQFGGNHTFSQGLEGTGVNVEPGSGTTIMGYAGITGSTDVQPHSDAMFHSATINQITNYVRNGNGASCPVVVVTGNTAPTSNAGGNFTIPISTPFELTGVGSDINANDVLSYSWEQNDNRTTATSTFPNVNSASGPSFRVFLPRSIPGRTFPVLASVLDGTNGNQWERLSAVSRTYNFNFVVRDNRPGGGQTKTSSNVITVTNSSGPFAVTSPNTNVSWAGGSSQDITWSVNNTTAAPVSCANVKVSLSTNGGLTFPTVLIASTPNDGSETLTIPVGTSTTARIKVEAVGNVFFDISNTNFTIAAPISDFTLSATTPTAITCGTSTTSTTTISSAVTGTFASPITLSATGVPAGTTVTFATNPIAAGGNTVATLNNTNTLAFGTYNVTISGTGGAITKSIVVTFTVSQGAAIVFSTNPTSQSACAGSNATFTAAAPGTVTYQWQVSNNGGTNYTNIPAATAASYTVTAATVAMNGNLYRAIATSQCSTGTSSAATLTVNTAPSITTQPFGQTVCAGNTVTFTAAATGTALTYQWQVSILGCTGVFNNIVGADAASYTTPPVTALNNGNGYRVIVSGTCAPAATSNCAVLTVGDAALITNQPQSVTVCSPANATFSVTATGSSLTYQWQVSTAAVPAFTNIPGANASTYTTATTPAMNGNQYRVIVFSCTPTGITSNAATLTVNTPVAISGQPTDRTVCQGESTTFTATASGTGLGYQWQYAAAGCAGTFTNITGATSASYTIASPTTANIGGYRVIVSGTCGNVTSACAALNVNTPIVITTQPQDQGLCVPTVNSATFSVAATGTAPTFQWQVSVGSGAFTNIVGATSATYTVTPLAVSQSGNRYRAVVSGTCSPAGVTSNFATLTVNSVVNITNQPTNVTACSESSASFTVVATGSTITYQWQISVNGGPFNNLTNTPPYSGVNTATLTINPITQALSGSVYRVVVAGVPCGSVNSDPVSLTVNPRPSVVLSASTVTNTTPVLSASSAPGAQVILATTISPVGSYSFVWFKNNVIIPVTTASFQLDPNDFGTYYVIATNTVTGCSQRSNDVTVTPQPSNLVFVYPNPNNGNFQVRYFNPGNAAIDRTINVFDSKGARVFSRRYTIAPGPFARMDVQLNRPTARGIYFVELRDAAGKLVGTSRILVN